MEELYAQSQDYICTRLSAVSCPAPFMHMREKVWSKVSHFFVLEVRILWPIQVAEVLSHDISGMYTSQDDVHLRYSHI